MKCQGARVSDPPLNCGVSLHTAARPLNCGVRRYMKHAALLTLLFTQVATAQSIVGLEIPPVPDGLVEKTGSCIAIELGIQRECEYSVGVLEDSSGKPKVIYGARLARRDAKGRAVWKVTAEIASPSLPSGYVLAIASCRYDARPDKTLVAAVRDDSTKQWYDDVLWVQKLDFGSGRFVEVSADRVSCANEGWGL
jgi:hypothetical protein